MSHSVFQVPMASSGSPKSRPVTRGAFPTGKIIQPQFHIPNLATTRQYDSRNLAELAHNLCFFYLLPYCNRQGFDCSTGMSQSIQTEISATILIRYKAITLVPLSLAFNH